MARKSNPDRGSDAINELIGLILAGDAPANEALMNVGRRLDNVSSSTCLVNPKFSRPPVTSKVDLYVEADNLTGPVGIAVISAKEGGGNQIERRQVDFYAEDIGMGERLAYLLKLFTGTITPSGDNRHEYLDIAQLEKGHAYFRDLSIRNQGCLLKELRRIRERLISRAMLGRENPVCCDDGKVRPDKVGLIAFRDGNKNPETAWAFCDPREPLGTILTSDVRPSDRGGRQIQLGFGITLKRYGGGLYAGDTSIKDHLQLQIQPRKVLAESTKWQDFNKSFIDDSRKDGESGKRGHGLPEDVEFLLDEGASSQSSAARRGLEAEEALIERINHREESCAWVVEECSGVSGYGEVLARKPSNMEKPDVVLFAPKGDQEDYWGISLKTYKPEVAFSQANRGTVDTYARDLKMPELVTRTLREFAVAEPDGERTMLNEAPEASKVAVLTFFEDYQRQILSHVLRGKEHAALKADWLMFHEEPDASWQDFVGDKRFWRLYPMASVISCCCSMKPKITKRGNLVVGLGISLQRKGGDGGRPTANDLQFKISPKKIIEKLGGS